MERERELGLDGSHTHTRSPSLFFLSSSHYDDKAAEAEQGFWNCPCVPMRERKVREGMEEEETRAGSECTHAHVGRD